MFSFTLEKNLELILGHYELKMCYMTFALNKTSKNKSYNFKINFNQNEFYLKLILPTFI